MSKYTENNMLKVAKRFNNTKRTYLLVNPLQAKHLPISPSISLEMMHTLGKDLAKKYPDTKLVIGFAETATAIGVAVASCFSKDCVYIHTTRESDEATSEWIHFEEEHSHAVDQLLCTKNLESWIAETKTILFVEDEISTGKTLINIIECLKTTYSILKEKELVVASLLNRVSDENEKRLLEMGLKCEYLVKLSGDNYAEKVKNIDVIEAEKVKGVQEEFYYKSLDAITLRSMNKGMLVQEYLDTCDLLKNAIIREFEAKINAVNKILILGTEECMYPALYIGKGLEERGFSVLCHATTRSPIGLNEDENYPIKSGKKVASFYGRNRDTYVYNPQNYDVVLVISDTKNEDLEAMNDLVCVFKSFGCNSFYFVQGGRNVWYI